MTHKANELKRRLQVFQGLITSLAQRYVSLKRTSVGNNGYVSVGSKDVSACEG